MTSYGRNGDSKSLIVYTAKKDDGANGGDFGHVMGNTKLLLGVGDGDMALLLEMGGG